MATDAAPVRLAESRQAEPVQREPDSKSNFEQPQENRKKISNPPVESKKDFEPSKPAFEPEDEIEYDRDSDFGRWRTDDQVKELVIYRHEWGIWPSDLEDKSSKDTRTGIESYYEVRYFKEGTNQKGVLYHELYAKHRARKRVWLTEDAKAGNAHMDTETDASNVVHFPDRRANSAG